MCYFKTWAVYVFGLFVFFIFPGSAKSESGIHCVANLSDTDRVILTFHQLDRGIENRQLELIIQSLSAEFRTDSVVIDSVSNRFQSIFDRLDALLTKATKEGSGGFTLTDAPDFHLHEVTTDILTDDTAIARYRTYLGGNPSYFSTCVNLALRNWLGMYGISNIFTLADSLDVILDSAEANPTKLTSDNRPSFSVDKSSTSGTSYMKSQIMHPAYSVGGRNFAECLIFSKQYARNNFDGKAIFNRPFDVFESIIHMWGDTYRSMISSDANWDRLIHQGAKNSDEYIASVNTYGQDSRQFRHPAGISILTDQDIFVCDRYNNTIAKYWANIYCDTIPVPVSQPFDTNSIINYSGVGYRQPVDIDAAHLVLIDKSPDNHTTYNRLAICDQGNNRIVITSMGGNVDGVIQGSIAGSGPLNRPTSVAFGRGFTGWHNSRIYVADAGNRRVISYGTPNPASTYYGSYYATGPDIFPQDAYLSSVEVDNIGQVYAVDSYNGIIYKFNSMLELIDMTGEIGADTGNFFYPVRMAVTKGWHEEDDPVLGDNFFFPTQYGDALFTEMYTDSTGIKRCQFTNRLIDFETGYIPRQCNEANDYIYMAWNQADYGYAKIYIHGDGFYTSYLQPFMPGANYIPFLVPYGAPEYSSYLMKLTLYSIYDLAHPVEIAQMEIQIYRDTCNFPPHFSKPPYIVYAEEDSCVVYGRPYQCVVEVEDQDDHPGGLEYTWIAHKGKFDDPETPLNDYVHDTIVGVNLDRLNILILSAPTSKSAPAYERIYEVRVRDMNGGDLYGDCRKYIYSSTDDCNWESPPPYCPVLYLENQGEWQAVNNLLAETEDINRPNLYVSEVYPIFDVQPDSDNQIRLRIAEEADEQTTLRFFRAFYIDYPDSLELVHTGGNAVWAKGEKSRPIAHAETSYGDTITDLLANEDGMYYSDTGPGEIIVEYDFADLFGVFRKPMTDSPGGPVLPPPDKGITKRAVHVQDKLQGFYSIYALDELDGWQLLTKIFPRLNRIPRYTEMSDHIINGKLTIKIEYHDPIKLDHIPFWFFKPVNLSFNSLALETATHNTLGAVTSSLTNAAGGDINLTTGEKVDITLNCRPLQPGFKRMLLIATQGMYEDVSLAGGDPDADFSFDQNYPNPFNPKTTFNFNLPHACKVNMTIYNVLGQTVTVLLDQEMPPGRHKIEWDSRNASGESVASGVYFARITAGEFTASRKIEVLK